MRKICFSTVFAALSFLFVSQAGPATAWRDGEQIGEAVHSGSRLLISMTVATFDVLGDVSASGVADDNVLIARVISDLSDPHGFLRLPVEAECSVTSARVVLLGHGLGRGTLAAGDVSDLKFEAEYEVGCQDAGVLKRLRENLTPFAITKGFSIHMADASPALQSS